MKKINFSLIRMSLITPVFREAEAIIPFLKYILYLTLNIFNEYRNIFLFVLVLVLMLLIFIFFLKK